MKRSRPAAFVVSRRPVKRAAILRAPRKKVAVFVPAPRADVRTGGFMGLEKKFVDYNVASDAFTTVWAGGEMEDGTALSLSAVAQGDGESQRDGRVYHIHSVHINGFLERAAQESVAAPVGDVLARLALVWDTQTNGAQLNAEDVFLTIGAGEDVNSWRNLQFSKRFIVLKDKKIRIPVGMANLNEGAVNLFANTALKIPFKINKTFKTPIKVRCSGTTAVVAAITDNSLHLIGTATNSNGALTYQSRVRFTG